MPWQFKCKLVVYSPDMSIVTWEPPNPSEDGRGDSRGTRAGSPSLSTTDIGDNDIPRSSGVERSIANSASACAECSSWELFCVFSLFPALDFEIPGLRTFIFLCIPSLRWGLLFAFYVISLVWSEWRCANPRHSFFIVLTFLFLPKMFLSIHRFSRKPYN